MARIPSRTVGSRHFGGSFFTSPMETMVIALEFEFGAGVSRFDILERKELVWRRGVSDGRAGVGTELARAEVGFIEGAALWEVVLGGRGSSIDTARSRFDPSATSEESASERMPGEAAKQVRRVRNVGG